MLTSAPRELARNGAMRVPADVRRLEVLVPPLLGTRGRARR